MGWTNTWIQLTWIRSWRIFEVACAFPMRFTQVLSWSKASPATADKATTSFLDTPGKRWRLAFSGYVWISSWSLNLTCNSMHPMLFVVFRRKKTIAVNFARFRPPHLFGMKPGELGPPSHICRLYKDVKFPRPRQCNGQEYSIQAQAVYFRVHKFHWEDLKLDTKTNSPASPFPKVSARKNTLGTAKTSWDFKQINKIWRSVCRSRCSWFEVSQWPKPLHTRCRLLPCKLSELRHANKRAPTKWASWTDELPFNFEPQNSCRCWFVW